MIASTSRACYAKAAGELIWIGPSGAPLHARTVLTGGTVPRAAHVSLEIGDITPWRPALPRVCPEAVMRAARSLGSALSRSGTARGLARLLDDGPRGRSDRDGGDDAVCARAAPNVRALAIACADDDADAAIDAAHPLLGLGEGLTPSGDDFVGGVLFARRICGAIDPAWETAIDRIVADAARLTHPISAQLLADLAAGEGWAPLHELAAALAVDAREAALRAAREVAALGHTSGWDLLGGFLTGLTAVNQRSATPRRSRR